MTEVVELRQMQRAVIQLIKIVRDRLPRKSGTWCKAGKNTSAGGACCEARPN